MNVTKIKSDSIEIVKRLKERNPEFFEHIKNGGISLEDFAEVVITQFVAFNNGQAGNKA